MEQNVDEQIEMAIANSRMAFLQGKNQEALDFAKEAINIQPDNADAYSCAGNAYMSYARYDKAIECYKKAVENDSDNGERYYYLGYALITNAQSAEGIAAFAKADEMGCSPDITGQLYKILGMICFDLGEYDDAIVNLCKAETIIGIDMDILHRKALSYGMLGESAKALEVVNQMKLAFPSDYLGYRIAGEILKQENRTEEVEKELERAKRFARPCIEYFMDRVSLELDQYIQDEDDVHLSKALEYIADSLYVIEPDIENVIDAYIKAAEIYVMLQDAEMIINCLGAAENPAESYNEGFSIKKIDNPIQAGNITRPSEREINKAIEEVRRRYGDREIERMGREHNQNTNGSNSSIDYLTPIEEKKEAAVLEKLDTSVEPKYTQDKIDQINRLYVVAYELKNDLEHIKFYASQLANSPLEASKYFGKYRLVSALKEEGYEKIDQEYEDLIRFFRSASIKDPTDFLAISLRIQCYIDIEDYDNAEKICSLLPDELKKPLLEEINKARTGGVS